MCMLLGKQKGAGAGRAVGVWLALCLTEFWLFGCVWRVQAEGAVCLWGDGAQQPDATCMRAACMQRTLR